MEWVIGIVVFLVVMGIKGKNIKYKWMLSALIIISPNLANAWDFSQNIDEITDQNNCIITSIMVRDASNLNLEEIVDALDDPIGFQLVSNSSGTKTAVATLTKYHNADNAMLRFDKNEALTNDLRNGKQYFFTNHDQILRELKNSNIMRIRIGDLTVVEDLSKSEESKTKRNSVLKEYEECIRSQ